MQDLSIEVSKGQSLLVVGHSGCGKSSLLRAIAGKSTLPSQHAVSIAAQRALTPCCPSAVSCLRAHIGACELYNQFCSQNWALGENPKSPRQ